MDNGRLVGRPRNGHRSIASIFCRIITLLVAVIGVSVQVYQISHMYFRYSTTTEVLVNVENELESPALSLCFKLSKFITIDPKDAKITFNSDEYNQYLSYQNGSKLFDDHGNLLYNKLLTLNRIFKFARNVTYHSCYYRNPFDERDVLDLNDTDCETIFEVKKYVTEDLICYRFQLAARLTYQFRQNMESAELPGVIYGAVFNFSDSKLSLTPNLHSTDSYGSISRLYPTARLKVGLNNFMRLTYARYSVSRLPRPYQTKCRSLMTECLKKCSVAQMYGLGVLPYAEEYDDNDLSIYGDRSIVSLTDRRILAELFQSNRKKCVQECDENCHDEWLITHVREIENRTGWELPWFIIRVDLPNRPFTTIEHKPQLLFNEYVIYVMSCFGAWLGISFLDLNPFKSRNGANPPAMVRNSRTRPCMGCRRSQVYLQMVMKEIKLTRRMIRDLIQVDSE